MRRQSDVAPTMTSSEFSQRPTNKSRQSLSNKRVSFGGENINLIYEHTDNQSEQPPPAKSSKISSASSPHELLSQSSKPLQTRSGSNPNRASYDLEHSDDDDDDDEYEDEHEHGHQVKTAPTASTASPTLPAPSAPVHQSPEKSTQASPLSHTGELMDTTAMGRSFDLFRDEYAMTELRQPDRRPSNDDATLRFTGWNPITRRRESTESEIDEGDVTQTIPNVDNLLDDDEGGTKPPTSRLSISDDGSVDCGTAPEPQRKNGAENVREATALTPRQSDDGLPLMDARDILAVDVQHQYGRNGEHVQGDPDAEEEEEPLEDTCVTIPVIRGPPPQGRQQRDSTALQNSDRSNRLSTTSNFAVDFAEMIRQDEEESDRPDPLASDAAPRRLTTEFENGSQDEELTLHWHRDLNLDGMDQSVHKPLDLLDSPSDGQRNDTPPTADEVLTSTEASKTNPGIQNNMSSDNGPLASTPEPNRSTPEIRRLQAPIRETTPLSREARNTPVKQVHAMKPPLMPETPSMNRPEARLFYKQSRGVASTPLANVTPSSHRPREPERGGMVATPRSPAASLMRAASEERASARARQVQTREVAMSSTLASSGLMGDLSARAVSPKPLIFANFLQGLKSYGINFEISSTSRRDASLLPTEAVFRQFERASVEGQVLEGARKRAVLTVLHEQIQRYREKIETKKEEWKVLSERLEQETPESFCKVCNIDMIGKSEITTYGLNLKRLRKICFLKSKLDWAEDRQVWDREIQDALQDTEDGLKNDKRLVGKARMVLDNAIGNDEYYDEHMVDGRDEEVNESAVIARRTVVQEMSRMRDLHNYLNSQKEEERELNETMRNLKERKNTLSECVEKLERYAQADTEGKLRKLLQEQKELHVIENGLSGLTVMQVRKNGLDVRLGRCMDVQFSIHEDRVINVSCKAVQMDKYMTKQKERVSDGLCGEGDYQSFIEDVNNVAVSSSGIRDLKYVRNIPDMCYRVSMFLLNAKKSLDELEMYAETNDGELISCGVVDVDRDRDRDEAALVVKVVVKCGFFCLKRRCKFDVTAGISTCVGGDSGLGLGRGMEEVEQRVEVEEIYRYFGDDPSDETIRNEILKGSEKTNSVKSLSSGFCQLWTLLDDGSHLLL